MADSTLVVSSKDFRLLEKYDDYRAAAHLKILKLVYWHEMTEEQTALVRKFLPYFTSLKQLVLSGDTYELFPTVVGTLAASDVKLTALDTGDLKWSCFVRLDGIERVFDSLESLKINFDDDYGNHTPQSILGLQTAIGYARNLVKLKCGMHWAVSWDDVARPEGWPDLQSLKLGPCKSSRDFLQSFFDEHPSITSFKFEGLIVEDKQPVEKSISLITAINFFSSATFNGVNGTICQDEFEPWGKVKLVLGGDNIQIVDRDGKSLRTCKRETV
ncbi:hypothetical protein N431DRAFT_232802 [Stipitochalara longipes BDJ]|nr:hypothetical protein N431DRAFT_232802 [Stipitochalara longipes BDJ]